MNRSSKPHVTRFVCDHGLKCNWAHRLRARPSGGVALHEFSSRRDPSPFRQRTTVPHPGRLALCRLELEIRAPVALRVDEQPGKEVPLTMSAQKTTSKIHVKVSFNSREHPFKGDDHTAVIEVKNEAIRFFGVAGDANALGLFKADNTPLDDNATLGSAGVEDHSTLYLRPRRVGGGR